MSRLQDINLNFDSERKGDKTKIRLIQSAIHLFSKHGFESTSFEAIAKKAGVSPTAPFHYFKDKETLFAATLKLTLHHNSKKVSEGVRIEDDALKRLKNHFKMNLEWAFEFREEAQIVLYLYYMASYQKSWSLLYEEILESARNKIQEILMAGVRESIFKLEKNPKEISEILHDALLGGIVNLVTSQSASSSELIKCNKKWDRLFQNLILP